MVENTENNSNKPGFSLSDNPWKLSAIILAVLCIILLVFAFRGGVTGNVVSEKSIGEKAVSFVNSQLLQGKGTVTLESVSETNGLYEVIVNYNGQKVPTYFTKDGQLFVQGVVPVSASASGSGQGQPAKTEVVKSAKPKVELFVMTYCPYGTQAEKGLIPALNLLGDKIDAKIRFVHYFMHGDKEEQETYTQLCIREEQAGSYLSYLECFLEDGNSSRCLSKAGIDPAKLSLCEQGKAKGYYASDSALSNSYGVQGSPTLIINGQEASSGRSSSALLSAICSAFNNEPSECNEKVSGDEPAPGFGYSGSATDNSGGSCG
ncbi:MAG TPA: hypothetical protein VJA86_03835, partial [Candidatus Nanoarchaeia archaeon]|nr:hypothetical protein [Candidatus Nanoarchaeia archaeon]